MELYGVAIIIILIAISYVLGLMTANHYHDKAARDINYALEKQYLRFKAGVDFYDPAGPYLYRSPVGARTNAEKSRQLFTPAQLTQFEAGLRDNGSATMMLNRHSSNPTDKNHNAKEN